MGNLYVYHPNHGFSDDDYVYVSWLDANYWIAGTGAAGGADSYRLALEESGTDYVRFTEPIYEGYVRLVTSSDLTTIPVAHLEGQTVAVVANGEVVATETVDSGEIVVLSAVQDYTVGLPYTFKVRTTRLEVPAAPTIQSRIKRINETVIRFIRTKGGKAGQEYGNNTYLDNLGASFSNQSQDKTIATKGGFTEDAYTTIISDTPFPMTIIAAIISFEVEETR